jgi:hypothetical protein
MPETSKEELKKYRAQVEDAGEPLNAAQTLALIRDAGEAVALRQALDMSREQNARNIRLFTKQKEVLKAQVALLEEEKRCYRAEVLEAEAHTDRALDELHEAREDAAEYERKARRAAADPCGASKICPIRGYAVRRMECETPARLVSADFAVYVYLEPKR